MDAGLDNANATNNPFANSNGTEILSQKEGFLLNLTDGFKQNGSEISPTNEYLYERSTNGKRSADEFDDDEDMGPETDIDAVDDISLSPSTEHTTKTMSENKVDDSFDPFATDLEDKVTLELDLNLQKQQSSEFDTARTPREETPTPPADEVHDVGLEDNVGDSGEDSEDEWNYYKGDTAEKESISKADQEVAKITEAEENSEAMSQLNPDAAEFVPISSPTRSTASPACRGLINDAVIAQSPRRVTPTEIDINLPNPQEFEKEVKSRPSDVYSNGDESDSDHKLTSQEVMENFLNGKNIDEIEFHPNTPSKFPNPDEFHFGPNAAPFSTPAAKLLDQSEATLSTKAVFGEESTASYLEGKSLAFESSFLETALSKSLQSEDTQDFQTLGKDQDPMSLSFYQEKNDDTNPFDLNKVQMLPDYIDDYLQKQTESETLNETISDLPEHNPLENADVIIESEDLKDSEACLLKSNLPKSPEPPTHDEELISETVTYEKISTVQHISDEIETEKTVQPSAPLLEEWEKQESLLSEKLDLTEELCQLSSKTPIEVEVNIRQTSPDLLTPDLSENICLLPPKSPASFTEDPTDEACRLSSKSSGILTPEPADDVCQLPHKSPALITPEPTEEVYEPHTQSPTLITPEPIEEVCELPRRSPALITPEPTEQVCQIPPKSPALITPEPPEEVCQFPTKSPVQDMDQFTSKSPEPTDEECRVPSKSPEPTHLTSESPVPLTPEPPSDDVCKISTKSPVALTPEPVDEICKISSKTPEPAEDVSKLHPESSELFEPTIPAKSPVNEIADLTDDCSPETTQEPTFSPEPIEEDLCRLTTKSPVALVPEAIEIVCQLPSKTPEPAEELCQLSSKTPEPTEELCQLSTKVSIEQSELLTKLQEPAHELVQEFIEEQKYTIQLLSAKSPDLFEEIERKEVLSPEPNVVELECNLLASKSPIESPESPMEDITSSVKDDVPSPINSPTDETTEEIQQISNEPVVEVGNLNFAQELASAVQEVVTNEISSLLEEKTLPEPAELSPSKSAVNEQIETESVATTDVNSFLERSNLSDVTSPLSPNEPFTLLQEQQLDTTYVNDLKLPKEGETLATKREVIEPEYPIKEIASPSEETPEEIKEEVPEVKQETPLQKEETPKENQEAPAASIEANAGDDSKVAEVAAAAVAATAVTALAGAAVVAVSSESEKKPAKPAKTATAATKKPTTRPSTSPVKPPTKTATPKPSATSPSKAAATTRVSKTAASPKAAPSPAKAPPPIKPPVSKLAPKPKSLPASTTKPSEKKAADDKKLVNGDVKSTVTRTLHATRKPTTTSASSAPKTASAPKTSAVKLSPTKTPTDTKPPLTRPNTAPGKTPATRTGMLSAPKPRPTSLATKTSTANSSSATRTSSTVSTTKSTSLTKTTTATSPKTSTAKPRTASTTAVPLHPRTTATKTTPKGPDTEKQLKETANKQLTASRTTRTVGSATGKTTTTVHKTETKAPGSRTISTKTTVTTIKAAKKPLEITRNVSKTKTTTTKTTKVEQNGLTNGITITQETTAIISSDPQMIKDLSPVETKLITDNSQLPEANFAD